MIQGLWSWVWAVNPILTTQQNLKQLTQHHTYEDDPAKTLTNKHAYEDDPAKTLTNKHAYEDDPTKHISEDHSLISVNTYFVDT